MCSMYSSSISDIRCFFLECGGGHTATQEVLSVLKQF